jgi:CRISPR-associated protein Csm3
MKLVGIKQWQGKIVLKTGLHIGSGDMEMRIGGTDNPVIKHPHTHEPYIPGSSLKGKVRSLLEMESGLMGLTGGKVVSMKTLEEARGDEKIKGEKILKLFGSSGADTDEEGLLGPTRVSFADCPLSPEWREKARERNLPLTEVKAENSINRIKGTADFPRFTERVPATAEFDFSVTLRQFENDEGQGLEDYLLQGLKLLEMDYLGGSGSRGYGRIKFEWDDDALKQRFEKSLLFT